jgi:hypothetical protein
MSSRRGGVLSSPEEEARDLLLPSLASLGVGTGMDAHDDSDLLADGLLAFLAENDVEELQRLVDAHGAERVVSTDVGGGRTPLHYVVATDGHVECVELLVVAGADVNARDGDFNTPLHLASMWSDYDLTVALLLEAGADLDARNSYDATPLHISVGHRDRKSVTRLLKAGADVSARDKNNDTPLHYACEGGFSDCVALLLRWGATPSVRDSRGRTPMHDACLHGRPDCVRLLLEAGASVLVDSGESPDSRVTPLVLAVVRGHGECVRLVLEAGADWTKVHGNGWSRLFGRRAAELVQERALTGDSLGTRLPPAWTEATHGLFGELARQTVEDAMRALLLAEARRAGCAPSWDAAERVLQAAERMA